MRFSKRNLHFLFFSLFYVGEKKQKQKKKMEKAKKPTIIVFLRGSSKNVKIKKWIFCKNCLALFVSRKGEKRAFSWHTICFGQKNCWAQNSVNQENYKNSGFSGNCPKQK